MVILWWRRSAREGYARRLDVDMREYRGLGYSKQGAWAGPFFFLHFAGLQVIMIIMSIGSSSSSSIKRMAMMIVIMLRSADHIPPHHHGHHHHGHNNPNPPQAGMADDGPGG
jgi:hypothetical protein